MADELFGGEGWFDHEQGGPVPNRGVPGRPSDAVQTVPDGDVAPPLDLTHGIAPEEIRRAGEILERALADQMNRGFGAMRDEMRASLLPGRTANPSDAQPIIARLTDARDFSLRMAVGWTKTAQHAEALVGVLLEEAGDITYGRTGAATRKAVVADGHGAEISAAYKPKIVHSVHSETVVGCIRALAGLIGQDEMTALAKPDCRGERAALGMAFSRGATWALETLLRLANVDRTWRRTEIDVLARQIEEAGNPELAAELRRAVKAEEEEGKTVIERREPSKGRARGAATGG